MEERIVNLFKDSTVKNILHIGACLGEENHGSNPGCSSLRGLKEHATMYPQIKFKNSVIVNVVNIDDFLNENNLSTEFDIVSLDTQGNDFDILTTSEFIFSAEAIVIETASIELYDGQVIEEKITEYMESKGFIKSYHSAWHPKWGDTLYVKK